MNNITIVEAPSNLGLIEPSPGKEPGVKNLPALLRSKGFYERIQAGQIIPVPAPAYSMEYDAESGVRNANGIAAYSKQLAKQVQEQVKNGKFPLVIGGDCSILIGCMLGLKQLGDYGLFFIDGHTDFVMPHRSFTKGAAGMDLAIVTGHGHDKLTDIQHQKPYVRESHVLAFGNRYGAKEYVDEILDSDIHYEDLKSIRKKGMQDIVNRFLSMVRDAQLNGFWIHLDVDVLDSRMMPCVDSPQEDGMTYAELKSVLKLLLQSKLVSGINIGILDPDLDPSGKYADEFVNEMGSVFSADFRFPIYKP
jgi:arginase